MSKIIEFNDKHITEHIDSVVRSSVEQTINAMLDAEADQVCNAGRYEHSAERKDSRS